MHLDGVYRAAGQRIEHRASLAEAHHQHVVHAGDGDRQVRVEAVAGLRQALHRRIDAKVHRPRINETVLALQIGPGVGGRHSDAVHIVQIDEDVGVAIVVHIVRGQTERVQIGDEQRVDDFGDQMVGVLTEQWRNAGGVRVIYVHIDVGGCRRLGGSGDSCEGDDEPAAEHVERMVNKDRKMSLLLCIIGVHV